jgi:hypothetical protein
MGSVPEPAGHLSPARTGVGSKLVSAAQPLSKAALGLPVVPLSAHQPQAASGRDGLSAGVRLAGGWKRAGWDQAGSSWRAPGAGRN